MKILQSIIITAALLAGSLTRAQLQLWPYQFERPDQVFELEEELMEISGLSISSDNSYLLAVQDEDGFIYYIDKHTGAIVRRVTFWKEGDYEGIEAVGKDIYVVKSTGTVYWVHQGEAGQVQTEKFNYQLDKDDDIEGLGYDARDDLLLLACKAGTEEKKDEKGIYGFSVKHRQLLPDPIYRLRLQAIKDYLDTNPPIMRLEKVRSFFDEDELDFSPSAIAVHPISEELFLLSSKGKMIIAMNRSGAITYIQKLEKEEHPQPEGLCFDQDGNLYIANEGKGKDGKGTISRYLYAPNR